MRKLVSPIPGAPIGVAYGAGVDSTAMLILLAKHGIRPDVIWFANTGGEKPETYEYLDVMDKYLESVGFPKISRIRYLPMEKTANKYLAACDDPNEAVGLYSEMMSGESLPSVAFGKHGCSSKWKITPANYFLRGCGKGSPNHCDPHPAFLAAKEKGVKMVKAIGYDASPADLKRAAKEHKSEAPESLKEKADFEHWYPLIDLGITRPDCIKLILEAGLPVPIKSACFFCPASKKWEVFWLAAEHPDLFLKALKLEVNAMLGKHTRFDEIEMGAGFMELIGSGSRWPSTKTTVGLGRSFAWNHMARMEKITDPDGTKVIMSKARLLAKVAELRGDDGGNAADSRKIEMVEMTEQDDLFPEAA
jgi:hypothetical protein